MSTTEIFVEFKHGNDLDSFIKEIRTYCSYSEIKNTFMIVVWNKTWENKFYIEESYTEEIYNSIEENDGRVFFTREI